MRCCIVRKKRIVEDKKHFLMYPSKRRRGWNGCDLWNQFGSQRQNVILFYLSSLRDQDQNKILHKINEVISKPNVTNEKHCSLMLAY